MLNLGSRDEEGYLTDVLTQLAAKPADVTQLLPDAWAKQHLPARH